MVLALEHPPLETDTIWLQEEHRLIGLPPRPEPLPVVDDTEHQERSLGMEVVLLLALLLGAVLVGAAVVAAGIALTV